MSDWDEITAKELRIAAKVARASGGLIMDGAAEVWERRADEKEHQSSLTADDYRVAAAVAQRAGNWSLSASWDTHAELLESRAR